MGGSLFIFTLVFKEGLSHFQPLTIISFKLGSLGYRIEKPNRKKKCHVFFHQTSISFILSEGIPCFVSALSLKIKVYFANFYWGLLCIRDEQGRVFIFIFPFKLPVSPEPFIWFTLIHLRKFVEHMLCANTRSCLHTKNA